MQKSTFVHSLSTATSQELSSPGLSRTRHDCQSEKLTCTTATEYLPIYLRDTTPLFWILTPCLRTSQRSQPCLYHSGDSWRSYP